MAAEIKNIRIEQGATFSDSVTWLDDDGDPVDLTDYSAVAYIRETYDAPLHLAAFACAITAPATGVVALSMPQGETALLEATGMAAGQHRNYVWDLKVEKAGVAYRLAEGKVYVSPEASRDTAEPSATEQEMIAALESLGHVVDPDEAEMIAALESLGHVVDPDEAEMIVALEALNYRVEPTFQITYDGNGSDIGEVPIDPLWYGIGENATASIAGTMDRTGYYFTGWNTAPDGSGTTFLVGEPVSMPPGGVTLYAVWAVIPAYVSSLLLGDTQDGTDYLQSGEIVVPASGGILFSAWTRVPMMDGEYPKTRGNNSYLVLNGGGDQTDGWSLVVVAAAGQVPELGSQQAIFNANTMFWGCGQIIDGPDSGWYVEDYTFFNDNDFTEEEIFGWVWSAVQIIRGESSFTIRQWYKVGDRPVAKCPESVVDFATMRSTLIANRRDPTIVNAWTPSVNLTSFTLGQLTGADPYSEDYVTSARLHTGTEEPTLQALEDLAARRTADPTAWGDWELVFNVLPDLTDRSGNEHDLSTTGDILEGPPFPDFGM